MKTFKLEILITKISQIVFNIIKDNNGVCLLYKCVRFA